MKMSACAAVILRCEWGWILFQDYFHVVDRIHILMGKQTAGLSSLLSGDQKPPLIPLHVALSIGQQGSSEFISSELANKKAREKVRAI